MFTAEIRINGGLIGVLYAHNKGSVGFRSSEIATYSYEYYEPEVGVSGRPDRKPHIFGEVKCERGRGIRHVLSEIFKDLDSKD